MHYRLMNEYCVDWPFWAEDGGCADGDPVLSPQLEADVRVWAAEFDDHYDVDRGWPTERMANRHDRKGLGLCGAVERELSEQGHTVELVSWETSFVRGV